jgi:UDPglucose 6-dehydrogenase
MSTSKKTVCVIGLWHLGLVNAVGFAEKGYNVVGLEFDSGASERIQKGILPLFEPGLQELVEKHIKAGFLSFTSDVSIVQKADYVVIAYDSPVNDQDEVDISPVVKAADRISSFLKSTTPVIITSQIPVGSSEMIQKSIQKKKLKRT